MGNQKLMRTVEATAISLFFLQAVRVLFSVLFGVIYDAIFEGPFTFGAVITNLLVFAVFLAPLVAPRRRVPAVLLATAVVVGLGRIFLTLNNPQVRLYSALLILAGGGLYLASLVRREPTVFPVAWIAALASDQLFRAFGHTFDITLRAGWLPVQVVLSAILTVISVALSRTRPKANDSQLELGHLGGLAIGAFLFLETSLLSLPNAIARWSEWSYAFLTPALLLCTVLPVLVRLEAAVPFLRQRGRLLGLLSLPLLCICLTIGERLTGLPAAVALLLAQCVLLLCLPSVLGGLKGGKKHVGAHLALGFLFFLLINFAYAFAFTYAYTLELFRGAGLPIVLLAGLVATLPTVWRGLQALPPFPAQRRWAISAAALLVALSALFAFPSVPEWKQAGSSVRVGTYNIHYGYDTGWKFELEAMARAIEESQADVVALQEVDTGRITSYGVDDALWLARRLRMGVYYQPTVEHLTGIAVLYRYPLEEAWGRLLTSRLEQTAIIQTRLRVGAEMLDAYGIWLGLEPEERAVQLAEALDLIGPGPAVFGGDLNSTPDSPIYQRLAAAGFADPFIVAGLEPSPTSPSEGPKERIDYVWIRGLRPVDAQVLESTASDHRMVVVGASFE